MKRGLMIISIYVLTGVMCMLSFYGCSENFKYGRYSNKTPELNVAMDYILGWSFSEQRGPYGQYAQVIFFEPKTKEKERKAGIILTVTDISKAEFRPLTAEGAAVDLLEKRLKLKDAVMISKTEKTLAGFNAIDIEMSYKMLEKPYSIDVKFSPVKERIIIFKKGDKLYSLRYENTAAEFDKLSKAFSHIIKSLKLNNQP